MLDASRSCVRRVARCAALVGFAATAMAAARPAAAPAGPLSATVRLADLARAVGRVQAALGTSSGDGDVIRFEVRDGRLGLAASRDRVTVTAEEPCRVTRDGIAAVHSAGLREALVSVAAFDVALEGTRGGALALRAGPLQLHLPAAQGVAFPEAWRGKDARPATLPAAVLRDMLDRTAFASSKDPQRYNLSGVFLESSAGELRMVATDGHRMSIAAARIDGALALGVGRILSSEAVSALRQLAREALDAGGAGARVELGWKGGAVTGRSAGMAVLARPIEGRFPDYRAVVPRPASSGRVSRQGLLEALRRVEAVGADHPLARLELAPGSLRVLSASGGIAVEETLTAGYKGKPAAVHLDPRYAIQALQVLSSNSVELAIGKPLEPLTLSVRPQFTAVIMPMKP